MSVVALERNRPAPSHARGLEIDVARDLNALVAIIALRSVVFMGEQNCPLEEEFDGNDFSAATHVIARIEGEPVGALRLRWFADFVKVERVLVKYEHRGDDGEVARLILAFALDLARRRGYRRALAYAQIRLRGFWRRVGFEPRTGRDGFAFSDHQYIEFERQLTAHEAALSIDGDPFVLLRPDGQWDRPGVLDRSAARPASNPHR